MTELERKIVNLGATATEHDTQAYAERTETAGDQTTIAADRRADQDAFSLGSPSSEEE